MNGWDPEESAVFLSAALRGEAQKILHGMADADCSDYAKLVNRLELRFGVEKQVELYQAKLLNRQQQEDESLKALAADVRNMSSLAYQDLAPQAQERFAVQHFIDAISDRDDRMRLRRDKPRTLDEALLTACELEAFRLVDTGLKKAAPRVRSVENVERETGQLARKLEELQQQIKAQHEQSLAQQNVLHQLADQVQRYMQRDNKPNVPLNQGYRRQSYQAASRREPKECWHCREQGHYRRDCPVLKEEIQRGQVQGNGWRAFPEAQGSA